jgi:hypothetical protein
MPTSRWLRRLPWPEGALVDRAPTVQSTIEETSDEPFDRAAFARRALELVRAPNTTVAICEGSRRLRVESGRVWGRRTADGAGGPERWALLALPPRASRRAIALAVAELARVPRAYALDLLLREARDAAHHAPHDAPHDR